MIAFYDAHVTQASPSAVSRRFLHGAWHAYRHLEAVLAEAGPLDLTELVVLEYAALSDLGPSAIADALRLPDHTVSRVLGRLEGLGLLERRLDPSDHRRRALLPTRAGRAQLDTLHAALQRHVDAIVHDHDAEQLAAFASVLTAIVAADAPSAATPDLSGSGAAPSDAPRGTRSRRR
jgi:DNA-binding MarR family transcriptional regulator